MAKKPTPKKVYVVAPRAPKRKNQRKRNPQKKKQQNVVKFSGPRAVAQASVRSRVKADSRLAQAICIPGSAGNLRVCASASSCEPTGATSLHLLPTFKQPTNKLTYGSNMPVGNSFMALFRDPLRAAIVFTPNVILFQYQAQFLTGSSVGTTMAIPIHAAGQTFDIDILYLTPLTTNAPHGDALFTGQDSKTELSWVWMDPGSTALFTQGAVVATGRLIPFIWNGESTELTSLAFGGGTCTFTATAATYPKGGYFGFKYLDTAADAAANTLTLRTDWDGDTFAHYSVPNAKSHLLQMNKARINAGSFMATPVASVLNQGGTITIGSVEGSSLWNRYLLGASITNLSSSYYAEFPFQKGGYAFLKPGEQSFDFHQYTYSNQDGNVCQAGFNIDSTDRFLVMALNSDVSGGTAPGLEWLATFVWDIEYQTSDQWYETHMATLVYQDYIDALTAVRTVPIFHENPLHWSDITKAIRSGFGYFRAALPTITKYMSPFLGSLGPKGGAGAMILNAVNRLNEAF